MSKTSIQATPQASPLPSPQAPAAPPARQRPVLPPWLRKVLKPVASLRVTVVLLVLSLFLVFFGTMAQIDAGTGTVIERYFRSFKLVWVPLQLFVQFGQVFLWVPPTAHVSGSFPFPGGYLLGCFLMANLLAAHLIRFKLGWDRAGILMIHGGLVLLMVGELVAGTCSVEGHMTIDQGGAANYVEHLDQVELAFIDPSGPDADDVVVVPGRMLKRGGLVQSPDLACDVEAVRFMTNSRLVKPGSDNPATAGSGLEEGAVQVPEESGTSGEGAVNTPAAYVTLKDKQTGQALGTYLTSVLLKPQAVRLGDKTYRVALRFKRTYKPYSLFLYEFRFDRYPGTNIPHNYSSRVRLRDSETGEDREVLIRMNEPLRHRGETFYQSNFDKKTEMTTVLQVVRNPGWLIPYLSCTLVSVGMMIHFGLYLNGFVRRRLAS